MRTTFRWDRDLECLLEVGGNANFFEEKGTAPAVISDDVGAGVNGLRHLPSGKMLDSKSGHRKETKARGLEEVGNDQMASKRDPMKADAYTEMVMQARDQIAGDWNGTRGWLEQERRKSR
jgi:hypothetical protein